MQEAADQVVAALHQHLHAPPVVCGFSDNSSKPRPSGEPRRDERAKLHGDAHVRVVGVAVDDVGSEPVGCFARMPSASRRAAVGAWRRSAPRLPRHAPARTLSDRSMFISVEFGLQRQTLEETHESRRRRQGRLPACDERRSPSSSRRRGRNEYYRAGSAWRQPGVRSADNTTRHIVRPGDAPSWPAAADGRPASIAPGQPT